MKWGDMGGFYLPIDILSRSFDIARFAMDAAICSVSEATLRRRARQRREKKK